MENILKILLGLSFLLGVTTVNGQAGRLKYANKQFDNMAYYYAAMGYEDVLERGVDSSIVAKKIATSYREVNNVAKADEWFDYLYRNGKLSQSEIIDYARLKLSIEDNAKSEELVSNYISKYGEDKASNLMLKLFETHTKRLTDEKRFELKKNSVNTVASELGVVYLNDSTVLVASAKKSSIAIDRIQAWTGNHYYNMYQSAIDKKGNLLKIKTLKDDANSKYNDIPGCYDSINGVIYFTRNSFLDGTKTTDAEGVTQLKIYKGDFDGERLENIQELSINSDEYSCGYPSISSDGKTLYFSSDKPGAIGGADIYKVSVNSNGILGTPVNLGEKVNTKYDELFPFIHPRENILFFSSRGHKGLGGHDVFIAKLSNAEEVKSVDNLGVPINSPMDDLGFVNNADQTNGYVASNRSGGEGSDDIYSFKQFSPYRSSPVVKGSVKDFLTSLPLDSADIQLVDKDGKLIRQVVSDADGNYEIYLGAIKDDFKLRVKKKGYVEKESLITYDEEAESYDEDILLMPVIEYYLAGKVQDKNTLELLKDVNVSIVDLKSNDTLPVLFTDEMGDFRSEIVNYIYGDTVKYEIILSKQGYISKTYVIKDFLATSSEIYVSGKLDVLLTPIEKGVEVGEEIGLAAIYFDLNSSELRTESKVELDKIVKFLNENPNVSLELGAHTDCRADDKYNVWLSNRRAKSSANYIKERISNPKRITSQGYGESKPVAECSNCEECTDEQHQLNRRTEFIIVDTKEKSKS